MELAGMLIAIAIPENPVYAITKPPTIVDTPAAMASQPIHFGYVRLGVWAAENFGHAQMRDFEGIL